MGKIVLVGIGGFGGSILRYVLSGYVQHWTKSAEFPFSYLVWARFGWVAYWYT